MKMLEFHTHHSDCSGADRILIRQDDFRFAMEMRDHQGNRYSQVFTDLGGAHASFKVCDYLSEIIEMIKINDETP